MNVDTVTIYRSKIHTLDETLPQVEALAVRGEWIVAAGEHEALTRAFPDAAVVDLGDYTVVPGLTDSHCHFLSYGLSLRRVELRHAASLREAVARVADAVSSTPAGAWVCGRGWDKNVWPDGRWPTRDDLDPVSPAHLIALTSKDGHLLWVNSRALKVAGIDERAQSPPGGEIVRDGAGRPTGLLKEEAREPVLRILKRPDEAALRRAVADAVTAAHRVGIVGVHDMEGPDAFRLFQALESEGALRLRIWMTVPEAGLDDALALGLRTGLGTPWLRVGGVKIFADGTLGSQTASMLEPFEGEPGNVGIAIRSAPELLDLTGRAIRGGLWPVIHAIGDRANRDVLDAFAAHHDAASAGGVRCRIEHAQLLHPIDLTRPAALGVITSMQPIHAAADRDIADRYWGERSATGYAFRSLLDAGTALAFGSDAPVETLDPWHGLYAAVTRRTPRDARASWYPEQRISPTEALRAYTVGAAYASGEERIKGRLMPGCLADFIVLDRDPLDGDVEALCETGVLATVIGGRLVQSRGALEGL